MAGRRRPHVVLDQDFPELRIVRAALPDIELSSLRTLHPDLVSGHDDWQVLQKLRERGNVDGFATLDGRMLQLPREMVVLRQTKLTLIVIADTANDPVAAEGLLMACSGKLARAWDYRRARIFRVRLPVLLPQAPRERISAIAKAQGTTPIQLERSVRQSLASQ